MPITTPKYKKLFYQTSKNVVSYVRVFAINMQIWRLPALSSDTFPLTHSSSFLQSNCCYRIPSNVLCFTPVTLLNKHITMELWKFRPKNTTAIEKTIMYHLKKEWRPMHHIYSCFVSLPDLSTSQSCDSINNWTTCSMYQLHTQPSEQKV